MSDIIIRLARFDERHALVELQRRASLAGYPPEVSTILASRPELFTIDPDHIARDQVLVASCAKQRAGFAVVLPAGDREVEIDGLFVDPQHWRRGVGSALVAHIAGMAIAAGASSLRVVSNPFADAFYVANGFVPVGKQQMEIGPPATVLVRALRQAVGR